MLGQILTRVARGTPGVAPALAARGALGLALVAGSPGGAHAHAIGSAWVQLLPTHLYIAGGAVVVAVSFLLVGLVPSRVFRRLEHARVRLGTLGKSRPRRRFMATVPSLLTLALVLALVVAGYRGSRDPLTNPLPLVVWSTWWIGFTVLHALVGNLWVRLNPWSGLWRVAGSLPGLRQWRRRPPLRYPARLGAWPAVALLAGFAWFELIHPAPADPRRLADAVLAYLVLGGVGMLLVGERAWLQSGEAFSVYFRMIAWLAPLGVRGADPRCRGCPACRGARRCLGCTRCLVADRPRELELTVPTLNVLTLATLGPGATAFVLLALGSVSFDGLSRTVFWLGLIGANPLEYPGRSALMPVNTAGLVGTWLALSAAYVAAVALGRALGRLTERPGGSLGLFVLSIVPIALGYHLAHYLPAFLVDAQYALRAASDPFARGWDLLGTRELPIVTSIVSDPASVYAIWYVQVAIIVAAHVAAVCVAHALALRLAPSGRAALLSQIPMVVLMIGYTIFGLWLLSTPSIA